MAKKEIATTGDDWPVIDEIIKAYIARHPLDWIEWKKLMEMRRNSLVDKKYASAGVGTQEWGRIALSFPSFQRVSKDGKKSEDNLKAYLDKVAPQIFKDKKILHEFMRRYPVFVLGSNV